jgi:hypothetical protein
MTATTTTATGLPPVPEEESALRREGERIAQLIDDLGAMGGAPIRRGVDELVRRLVHLYGTGLTRLVRLVGPLDAPTRTRLCEDALVSSLLLLHDAHPMPEAVAELDPGRDPTSPASPAPAAHPSGLVQIDLGRSRGKPETP